MIMKMVLTEITNIGFSLFAIFLIKMYFDIFLDQSDSKKCVWGGYLFFLIWQLLSSRPEPFPAYINITFNIIVTVFTITIAYKGRFLNKCIFVVTFNAIWMLTETLCGFILQNYYRNYLLQQQLGAALSMLMLLMVVLALKKVFTDEEIRELPTKCSLMLIMIPIGSIYIIYILFMLSSEIYTKKANVGSFIAAIILLIINILIFSIYLKLAEDLQLKRCNMAYELQLELCEKHQQEREDFWLKMRDARHNIKNHLVTILAFIDRKEYQKIVIFINEIIGENRLYSESMSDTGNIVIDSLINYWADKAKQSGICFHMNAQIPTQVPFKGADISLILGNALANAVEAADFCKEDKNVYISVNYDRENLILTIKNSFCGYIKRNKTGKLISTKCNEENHGLGLDSIFRTVKKYQGTMITDIIGNQFYLRILLYNQKNIE
jgi:two-component system sensor histidine kinase AgrC